MIPSVNQKAYSVLRLAVFPPVMQSPSLNPSTLHANPPVTTGILTTPATPPIRWNVMDGLSSSPTRLIVRQQETPTLEDCVLVNNQSGDNVRDC